MQGKCKCTATLHCTLHTAKALSVRLRFCDRGKRNFYDPGQGYPKEEDPLQGLARIIASRVVSRMSLTFGVGPVAYGVFFAINTPLTSHQICPFVRVYVRFIALLKIRQRRTRSSSRRAINSSGKWKTIISSKVQQRSDTQRPGKCAFSRIFIYHAFD